MPNVTMVIIKWDTLNEDGVNRSTVMAMEPNSITMDSRRQTMRTLHC